MKEGDYEPVFISVYGAWVSRELLHQTELELYIYHFFISYYVLFLPLYSTSYLFMRAVKWWVYL